MLKNNNFNWFKSIVHAIRLIANDFWSNRPWTHFQIKKLVLILSYNIVDLNQFENRSEDLILPGPIFWTKCTLMTGSLSAVDEDSFCRQIFDIRTNAERPSLRRETTKPQKSWFDVWSGMGTILMICDSKLSTKMFSMLDAVWVSSFDWNLLIRFDKNPLFWAEDDLHILWGLKNISTKWSH